LLLGLCPSSDVMKLIKKKNKNEKIKEKFRGQDQSLSSD
jgi:hypothetical protein